VYPDPSLMRSYGQQWHKLAACYAESRNMQKTQDLTDGFTLRQGRGGQYRRSRRQRRSVSTSFSSRRAISGRA
jgi:hypothetical protein